MTPQCQKAVSHIPLSAFVNGLDSQACVVVERFGGHTIEESIGGIMTILQRL